MKNRYDRFFKTLKDQINLPEEIFIKLSEIKQESKLDKGLKNVINGMFYGDVWYSENLSDIKKGDNFAVLEFEYGNKTRLGEFLKKNFPNKKSHPILIKKLTNLKGAVKLILKNEIPPLTIDFIKKLHKKIMKDLLVNRGEIRNTIVKPFGSSNLYCLPQFIEKRLNELLNFVNLELEQKPNNSDKLLLGILFFTEFLLIHPFSNGNGRTARILLSLFIDPPLPITFSCSSNEEYFNILEDRHNKIDMPPVKLTNYILQEIKYSIANIHHLTVE